MNELKYISGSSIQDYLNCQQRWCFRWLDGRVPKKTPQALTTGKMIHEAFETHFETGDPLDKCLQALVDAASESMLDDTDSKALKEVRGLIEPLAHWKDAYPIEETLEVEEPFEFYVGNELLFRGRPDRVTVVHGGVVHFQHKTIGAAKDIGLFISMARRSFHELIYGMHLEIKYCRLQDRRYLGTIYNIIRKLKYKSEAKGKNFGKILHEPHEFFLQTLIGIDPEQQKQCLRELHVLAAQMKATAEAYSTGTPIPSNRMLDTGMFGNSRDPYAQVMLGELDLADDTVFQDREELYESK